MPRENAWSMKYDNVEALLGLLNPCIESMMFGFTGSCMVILSCIYKSSLVKLKSKVHGFY